MIFPYQRVRRGSEVRSLPLVPVSVGYSKSVKMTAMVDSGAEQNVFHSQVAEDIELDLSKERQVKLMGYDGSVSEGGIIEKPLPIHHSNAMLIDPKSGVPTRIRRQRDQDGTVERIALKSGQSIPRNR